MNIHQNARLTPLGRERMVRAIVEGGHRATQVIVGSVPSARESSWRQLGCEPSTFAMLSNACATLANARTLTTHAQLWYSTPACSLSRRLNERCVIAQSGGQCSPDGDGRLDRAHPSAEPA